MICGDGLRVGFDYLIIGNGITTNHFGIPGAAEYTMSMYTRAEALRVRDTIFGSLEIIAGQSDPNTSGFTVVIVGGGPTGVEMAGQLAELKTETIPSTYPETQPGARPRGAGGNDRTPAGAVRRFPASVRVARIDQAWCGRSAEDCDLGGGGGSSRLQGWVLDAG